MSLRMNRLNDGGKVEFKVECEVCGDNPISMTTEGAISLDLAGDALASLMNLTQLKCECDAKAPMYIMEKTEGQHGKLYHAVWVIGLGGFRTFDSYWDSKHKASYRIRFLNGGSMDGLPAKDVQIIADGKGDVENPWSFK